MNPAQMDIMQRTLELAASAREGLDYVNDKNREGDFESAARVLTDVIASFAQIQEVFPLIGLGDNPTVEAATASLQEGFRQYLERYEARDHAALLHITQLTLLPRYTAWQEALEQALRPHLAS